MTHKSFLFFGTPYVARDTLAFLLSHGYRPEVVITSPDAPKGRGQVLTPCETKVYAEEQGLPVLTPEQVNETFIDSLQKYDASYAIVVAYGKILPQKLIDAFPLGILNIHYSLLPQYRGASPVETALLSDDTETGVSIQQMVYALDAGDVLAHTSLSIEPEETTRELRPRLIALGSELLVTTLPAFEAGTLTRMPQDHTQATHTRKIPKEAGALSLTDDARSNWNKYRAYAESPGTYFFMKKEDARIRVKIRTATYTPGTFTPLRVVPEGKNETDYTALLAQGFIPVDPASTT